MAEITIVDTDNQALVLNYPIINTLAAKLKRKVEARGINYVADDDIIDEIKSAIDTINGVRRYVPTQEKIVEQQYYSLIIELAISAISKYGAEGQTSHSENGISRSYENGSVYPKSLLSKIVPLAKGV